MQIIHIGKFYQVIFESGRFFVSELETSAYCLAECVREEDALLIAKALDFYIGDKKG